MVVEKYQLMPIQVVAEHLFHEGKFAVGEKLIQEAGIAQGEALQKPFEAMHQVLQEVRSTLVPPRGRYLCLYLCVEAASILGINMSVWRISILRTNTYTCAKLSSIDIMFCVVL